MKPSSLIASERTCKTCKIPFQPRMQESTRTICPQCETRIARGLGPRPVR